MRPGLPSPPGREKGRDVLCGPRGPPVGVGELPVYADPDRRRRRRRRRLDMPARLGGKRGARPLRVMPRQRRRRRRRDVPMPRHLNLDLDRRRRRRRRRPGPGVDVVVRGGGRGGGGGRGRVVGVVVVGVEGPRRPRKDAMYAVG